MLHMFSLNDLRPKPPKAKKAYGTQKAIGIAVFASGTGSNAENLFNYFNKAPIQVQLLVCNRPNAPVLKKSDEHKIPSYLWDPSTGSKDLNHLIQTLKAYNIQWIVLAGFLKKIPQALVQAYRKRILNIHPSLLPDYGGKGFYGNHVHQAVLDNREQTSGITIHHVNEYYDQGDVIFQQSIPIDPNTLDATALAKKIQALEHEYYPIIIKQMILKELTLKDQSNKVFSSVAPALNNTVLAKQS